MYRKSLIQILTILGLLVSILACSRSPSANQAHAGKLQVLATTTIVSDVVKHIGDDRIELGTFLPVGVDPHTFEPAPQDVARIANADVILANGVGLEAFLGTVLESAGATDKVFYISEGITLLKSSAELTNQTQGQADVHSAGDPHVWTDPNNVKIWVRNITQKLSALDPANAQTYQANAQSYDHELDNLDAWIRQQVRLIPPQNRKIVADHVEFTYFADEYGFTQVGAIIPGYSTVTEPTAQDIARLEDAIRGMGVKAIFVGNTFNPSLANRVAEDTGIKLVFIYHASLSEPNGPAASYLDYIRYNVTAIVSALK